MDKLVQMLTQTGIPFAYDHFAEGEGPDPPFICYLTPGSNNFSADCGVYQKIDRMRIELYTDKKYPATERRLEDALDEYGIFYDKTETWISSEKLYEVMYEFEEVNSYVKEQ